MQEKLERLREIFILGAAGLNLIDADSYKFSIYTHSLLIEVMDLINTTGGHAECHKVAAARGSCFVIIVVHPLVTEVYKKYRVMS